MLVAFLVQFYLNYLEMNIFTVVELTSPTKKLSSSKSYLVRERKLKEALKKVKVKWGGRSNTFWKESWVSTS